MISRELIILFITLMYLSLNSFAARDLEGIWNNGTLTPLERPDNLAGKEFFEKEEAKAYSKNLISNADADKVTEQCRKDPKSKVLTHTGLTVSCEKYVGSYNEAWWDVGTETVRTLRTSIITDPSNGKLPPFTSEEERSQTSRKNKDVIGIQSHEDIALEPRCLMFKTQAPPMLPYFYNNNFQIFQSEKLITIHIELGHAVRFIHLDGRPHLPSSTRLWLGDSIGHWEGDTLVVDTTNFYNQSVLTGVATFFVGTDQGLHVIEKFTRVSSDTILYQFTVDNPKVFSKPWKGELTFAAAKGPIYEYACHEGNSTVEDMLSRSRSNETSNNSFWIKVKKFFLQLR